MRARLSFVVAAAVALTACGHDLPSTMPTGEFSLAVWLKPGKPAPGPGGTLANGQGLVLSNGNGWFEGLRLVLSRRGTDA